MPSEGAEDNSELSGISDRKMMEAIFVTVRENKEKLSSFEQSLSFVNAELEDQKRENAMLKKKNEEMEKRMTAMEEKMNGLEIDLVEQGKMRDENEQNSRMVNLEISGVPQLEGETDDDCKELAGKVMALVGSKYSVDDVDDAHRKMAGGLIVRFMSRTVRKEVYEKRFELIGKKAKDLAPRFRRVDGKDDQLYINENLSYDRSKLMKFCREKLKPLNEGAAKDDRIKMKTVRGVIKVQNSSGNFIKVKSFADFKRLYPDA